MIDRDRLVKTFCDLVQIDSPSGEEAAMTAELTKRLEGLGLETELDDYGNLIARKGEGDNPLLLSAHMDTVEPGRGVKPTVRGDRIESDGTTILGGDCKCGVSAVLEALESIHEDGTEHIPIEVVLTREEEPGLIGARKLDYSKITATDAVVFDGEGPPSRITSASPTYIGFRIEVTGRAAHAGVEPEKGLSAIRIASEIVTRLPQGRLDEETTFNVGTIEGGSVRNTVPEQTILVGEFRSLSLETMDAVLIQLNGVLGEVREMFPAAVIDDHLHTEFEAYSVDESDPMVRRITEALEGLGMKATLGTSGGGSDGNIFRQRGINSVVVGMGDNGMHTVREYVAIPYLVDTAHLCEEMVRA